MFKIRKSKNSSRGFVLTELMLGVAVVAVLAVIGAGVYKTMVGGISAEDMANKAIAMSAEIQRIYKKPGFTTVSPVEINKISLVQPPMRMSGSNLLDAWGNTMSLNGGAGSFAMTIGGATAPLNNEDCATIATKLESIASVIRIGASASVGSGGTAGTVTGGNLYKTGATITQTAMTDGCSEANTVIAAQFR